MIRDVRAFNKISAHVDDLAEAWAFVMAHVDGIGSYPTITIQPIWVTDEDDNLPATNTPPAFIHVQLAGGQDDAGWRLHEEGDHLIPGEPGTHNPYEI